MEINALLNGERDMNQRPSPKSTGTSSKDEDKCGQNEARCVHAGEMSTRERPPIH